MDEESEDNVIQEHISALEYHMKQGLISRRQLEYLSKVSTRKLNELLSEGNDKEYLNLEQGIKAYSKILETGITAQEALEYVAECYGKDQDWINEVKNNNYLHAKEVFYKHEDHVVQKAMAKDGTLRRKALKNSKTPNSQLIELHGQRKLHSTLNDLKDNNNKLYDKVEDLEATTVITESNVDTVMDILDIDRLTSKDKASKLKAKGITQKKIAEFLGVNIKTVKRWWSTI